MKATIDTKELNNAIAKLNRLPGSSERGDATCSVTITDSGLRISRISQAGFAEVEIPATETSAGEAELSFTRLKRVTGSMSGESATVESEVSFLAIRWGSSTVRLPKIIGEPTIHSIWARKAIGERDPEEFVDAHALAAAISAACSAAGAAVDATGNIYIDEANVFGSNRAIVIATKLEDKIGEATIPADAARFLADACDGCCDLVKLGENSITLSGPTECFSVQLGERGLASGIKRVIAEHSDKDKAEAEFTIDRKSLLSAAKATGSLSDEFRKTIEFTKRGKLLTLSVQNQDCESVSNLNIEGDSKNCAFHISAELLLKFLEALPDDTIKIQVSDFAIWCMSGPVTAILAKVRKV